MKLKFINYNEKKVKEKAISFNQYFIWQFRIAIYNKKIMQFKNTIIFYVSKSWYVFSRLADTGKIQSLDIKGHYCNFEDESQENYDRIYTIAEQAAEEVNIHRYIQSGMFEDCECCRIKYQPVYIDFRINMYRLFYLL